MTQDRTQKMRVYEQTNGTPEHKNAGLRANKCHASDPRQNTNMCGYKDSRFDSSLSPRHGLVQLQIQRFLLGNGVSSILLNLF